jgi:predicted lipoprotein with Yx(FWY)xxD motif
MYTPDQQGKSSCNGQCAAIWPPLLTTGKMRAAHGVKSSLLGTIKRKDGTTQVTYAGHPLYLFAQDAAPGDVNGQGVQSIWYALSITGSKVTTPPPPATIQLGQTTLGSVLVNPGGLTLYMFTPDSGAVSGCYGGCATTWPPLLLNGGTLRAGAGLQTSLLGTMQRTDGTTQVTYAGHPLYVYSKDTGAGQTNGQGIAAKWYVLSAAGAPVGAAP